jgi:tetratricopeptide (TPR) repeat protein
MNDANYYFVRGRMYEEEENYDSAIVNYDQATRLEPDEARYYAASGMAYAIYKQDYDRAITDLTHAIMLDSRNNSFFFERDIEYEKQTDYAITYDEQTKYDKAVVDFTRTIPFKPDDAKFYFYRGIFYAAYKKDYDRAIADLSQAITLHRTCANIRKPDAAEFYFYRGLLYHRKEDYGRAIADFMEAVKLMPNIEDYKKHLSICERLGEKGNDG